MTTPPDRASAAQQGSIPEIPAPQIPLLISEEGLNKRSFRAGAAPQKPGVALVYAESDGSLHTLNRPLRFSEVIAGTYRRRYEVSLIDYEYELSSLHELPTLDDAFSFGARIRVGFRVTDPIEIIRRGIKDGLQLVRWHLFDTLRTISRKYPPEDRLRAEEEINKTVGARPDITDSGITIYRFSASLFLDSETYGVLQQRRAIERDNYTAIESNRLQRGKIAEEHALEEQRMRFLERALEDEGLISLHLARHPDDTRAVIDLLVDRYDKDREERLELFRTMLQANLLQSADVDAIRDILLSNSFQMLQRPFERGNLASDQQMRPALGNQSTASTEDIHADEAQAEDVHVGVQVYLDTENEDVAQEVFRAVEAILDLAGLAKPTNVETLRGSIWRRAFAHIQQGLESDEVSMRLIKIERAIELAQVDNRQADVDLKLANSVSQLLGSLSEVPQACVRVGSLLLIKYTEPNGPVVFSRSLSQAEIYALERFPEIQTKPREVLTALASAISINEAEDEL